MAEKIFVMIDSLHAGGVEKIALKQVIALKKLGYPASLLVLKSTDYQKHPFKDLIGLVDIEFLDKKFPALLKIDFKIPFFSFFSFFHLYYPFLIMFFIKKGSYPYILAHGTYTAFSALSLQKFKGSKVGVFIWDPIHYILKSAYKSGVLMSLRAFTLPIAKAVDRFIINRSDNIFIAGKAHLAYLKALGPKRIDLLYPGVDPSAKIVKEKDNYILCVTAWKPGKNLEFLLEIGQKLKGLRILVAGSWYSDEFRQEFESKVTSNHLDSVLEVLGPVTEERLQQLYQNALVFLQISDDRGFGMGALEAAGNGCTFIIPPHQGVGEIFENGRDGYVVDLLAKNAIMEKIDLLAQRKLHSYQMGERAYQKVLEHYSWSKHVEKLLKGLGYERN